MSAEEKAVRFSADCPCRPVFDQVVDKWSMMILTVLELGPARFNGLKRRLEGVSQGALSQTLKRLERNGIITRRVIVSAPPGVEYALSPIGRTLLPPLQEIYRWTRENQAAVVAARAAYDNSSEDSPESGTRASAWTE